MINKVIPIVFLSILIVFLSGCPNETEGSTVLEIWTNASVDWEIGTLTDVVLTFYDDGTFTITYQTSSANSQSGTYAPANLPPDTTITMTVVESSGPTVPTPGGDDWYLRYSNLTETTVDIEFDGNGDGFEGPDTFQRQ